EVAGLRTSGILDTTAVLNGQAASSTPHGAAITTTRAGDFVVEAAMVGNVITGIHTGTAFTNDHTTQDNGWAHLTSPMAPAGTYQAQWDQPQAGAYCASSAAFFAAP